MTKVLIILLLLTSTFTAANAQPRWNHGRLVVSADGHHLQNEDGTPFFWLGDTAWELFHRLTVEEITQYLDNRAKKGFTVIQAVVVPEMDGLRVPNRYGQTPFHGLDPTKPNERYFQLIDTVLQLASDRGLFVGLLPTWGDKVMLLWGVGPVVFNAGNAFTYGKWIADRYKDRPNVVWILGGDRPAQQDSIDTRPVWRAMARGILDATHGHAFITYHPSGGERSTSRYIHDEDWLAMNMVQSGHGSGHDVPVWNWIERDRALVPPKPVIDAEPNYEDHPVNPWPVWDPANGYFRDHDVRKQMYRSVFAGAAGVTYGHHSVWQFWSPREEKINYADRYWTEALDRQGAAQAGYLRWLLESRPFERGIPDQSLIRSASSGRALHAEAYRDSLGSFVFIYLPEGGKVETDLHELKKREVAISWFNPRNGTAIPSERAAVRTTNIFNSPDSGREHDWVLVLDDPSAGYGTPGMRKN
jgi:hypothetical protein